MLCAYASSKGNCSEDVDEYCCTDGSNVFLCSRHLKELNRKFVVWDGDIPITEKYCDEVYEPKSDLKILLPIVCSRETSLSPDTWTPENPLWGHCAVVALLVQDILGGELLRASLEGTKWSASRSHYWNRLPNGREIDLTKSQFGSEPPVLSGEVRGRDYLLSNKNTKERYELLKQKYHDYRNAWRTLNQFIRIITG